MGADGKTLTRDGPPDAAVRDFVAAAKAVHDELAAALPDLVRKALGEAQLQLAGHVEKSLGAHLGPDRVMACVQKALADGVLAAAQKSVEAAWLAKTHELEGLGGEVRQALAAARKALAEVHAAQAAGLEQIKTLLAEFKPEVIVNVPKAAPPVVHVTHPRRTTKTIEYNQHGLPAQIHEEEEGA